VAVEGLTFQHTQAPRKDNLIQQQSAVCAKATHFGTKLARHERLSQWLCAEATHFSANFALRDREQPHS
jgi:hypothetical protein